MTYYGIAGPGVQVVLMDWKTVEDVVTTIPYCSYRKFVTEEQAREFVKRHKKRSFTGFLYKYGDTFDIPYLSLRYIIYNNCAYYTINTRHFGNIRLDTPALYMANRVLVKKQFECLNRSRIADNVRVIVEGVELFGSFIDIDVIVPDMSVYYACACYDGNNKELLELRGRLSNRLARVSYSMEVKRDGQR